MNNHDYDPLEYIRNYYRVPAVVGRVVYARGKRGVVVGASGPHVRVHIDGARHALIYHPTWEMRWTDEIAPLPKKTRSQRNYDAYLSADTNETFIEFMCNPYWNDLRARS